jgi:hypothetical protein
LCYVPTLSELQSIDDVGNAEYVPVRTVPRDHPFLRRCFPFHPSCGRRTDVEIAFFIGAFVLLTALIYGTLSYRYRNRAAQRAGEDIVREHYRRNET